MTESSEKVNTYSIGFNSPVDETHDAAETARLLGTDHHEIQCGPEDFDLLPKVVWHMDRPVGDALVIAFYKLAEGAGRDLKVIISGEGADEIFAGYSFQNVIQLAEWYHQLVPEFLHQQLAMPMLRALPVDLDRLLKIQWDEWLQDWCIIRQDKNTMAKARNDLGYNPVSFREGLQRAYPI
jgi:asparagine synthase (glutamine-hydrolysing)